jgi:hypothetical protein
LFITEARTSVSRSTITASTAAIACSIAAISANLAKILTDALAAAPEWSEAYQVADAEFPDPFYGRHGKKRKQLVCTVDEEPVGNHRPARFGPASNCRFPDIGMVIQSKSKMAPVGQ